MSVDHSAPSPRDPYVISIPVIRDEFSGSLGVIEYGLLPFKPQRTFYQYDVPEGARRGGHAHLELEQFIVCLSGNMRVDCISRHAEPSFTLPDRSQGLYVPPMTWVDLTSQAESTVVLVLASAAFDEADYICDRSFFQELISTSGVCPPKDPLA